MEGGEQWGRVHKVYNWFGLATGHGKCIIYRRDPIAFHLASRPDVPLSNANGVEARSPGLVRGTRTTLGSPVVAGTTATRLWRCPSWESWAGLKDGIGEGHNRVAVGWLRNRNPG
jgi:hypothetical protein